MENSLRFNPDLYRVISKGEGEQYASYRAYMGITYCMHLEDSIQKMNIFVPEAYMRGEEINGYDRASAPVFIPFPIGGYMPGEAQEPVLNENGEGNSLLEALRRGYVVVAPGIRGRTSKNLETGKYTGKAPALVADAKAVIRYLRHNRDLIPGNMERMIVSGTSAGGALSALVGATGNHMDYLPYLTEMGAADEKDDVFAANCYCPIHNIEHADMAYEWQFCGINTYAGSVRRGSGVMNEKQIALSAELKAAFPAYVNSLGLKKANGERLTLDEQGNGNFKELVRECLVHSAQIELDTTDSYGRLNKLAVSGLNVKEVEGIEIEHGFVRTIDFEAYIRKLGRMKYTPAFDSLDMVGPENEVLGTEERNASHFTESSMKNSEVVESYMAASERIRMLNPLNYIGGEGTAKHWRIRHGAADSHTSLAIPVILAQMLMNCGYEVDFHLPWALPHAGDYDLDELFNWIDRICKG